MAIYLIDYENVHDAGLEGIARLKKEDNVIVFYGINIKAIPFDRHVEMMNSKADIEFIKTAKVAKNYLDFQLTTYLGFLVGKGEKGPVYVVSKDTGFDSVIDFWKGRNVEIKRVVNLQLDEKVATEKKTATKKPAAKKPTTKKKTTETEADNSVNTKKTATKTNRRTKKSEKPDSELTEEVNKELSEDIKNNDQAVNSNKKSRAEKSDDTNSRKAPSMPESFRKKIRAAVKKENLQASKYTSIYKAMESATNHSDYKAKIVAILGKDQGDSVYNHTQIIYSEYKVSLESN